MNVNSVTIRQTNIEAICLCVKQVLTVPHSTMGLPREKGTGTCDKRARPEGVKGNVAPVERKRGRAENEDKRRSLDKDSMDYQ